MTRTVTTQMGATHVVVTLDTLSAEMDTHVEVCAVWMMIDLLLFHGDYCTDNNECSSNATNSCEHTCINTIGSYTCDCHFGYMLNEDGRSCRGDWL